MSNPKGNPQNLRRDGCPGHRGAGGRPPGWVKRKAAKLVEKHKLIEFMARVGAGLEFDHRLNSKGKIVKVPASVYERRENSTYLIDQADGKAAQTIQGPGGDPLVSYVVALPPQTKGKSGGIRGP